MSSSPSRGLHPSSLDIRRIPQLCLLLGLCAVSPGAAAQPRSAETSPVSTGVPASAPLSESDEALARWFGFNWEDRTVAYREILRRWPDSPAAAYVRIRQRADELDSQTSPDMLREVDAALRSFPDYAPIASWIVPRWVERGAAFTTERVLEFVHGHPRLFAPLFIAAYNALPDADRRGFVDQIAQRRPDLASVQHLRGCIARGANKPQDAARFFATALAAPLERNHGLIFDAVITALNAAPANDPSARVAAVESIVAQLRGPDEALLRAAAWSVCAEELIDRQSDLTTGRFCAHRSYQTFRSIHATYQVHHAWRGEPSAEDAAVEADAEARFPNAWQLMLFRASRLLRENRVGDVDALVERALAAVLLPSERRDAILRTAYSVLFPRMQYREAARLLASLPATHRNQAVRWADYYARLGLQDFDGARRVLAEYRAAYTVANEDFFASQRERIAGMQGVPPTLDPQVDVFSTGVLGVLPDGRSYLSGNQPAVAYRADTGAPLRAYRRVGRGVLFSPDGRWLASRSSYRERDGSVSHSLMVHEVATGAVRRAFVESEDVDGVAWSPDARQIAWYTRTGYVHVHDLQTDQSRTFVADRFHGGGKIVWTRDGQHLVTSTLTTTHMTVWRASDFTRERDLTGTNWVHALSITSDGRYLIAVDNTRTLSVWDVRTWSQRQFQIERSATEIAPHPRRPVVALSGAFGDRAVLFDVAAGRSLGTVPMETDGVAVWQDPRTLLVQRADDLAFVQFPSLQVLRTRPRKESTVRSVQIAGAGRLMVQTGNETQALETTTLRRTATWSGAGALAPRRHADTASTFVMSRGRSLVLLDAETGNERPLPIQLDFEPSSVAFSGATVAVGGLPAAQHPSCRREIENRGIAAGYSVVDGRETWRREFLLNVAPLRYGRIFCGSVSVAFDESNARALVATGWVDGFGMGWSHGRFARLWDTRTQAEPRSLTWNRDVDAVSIDDDHSPRMFFEWTSLAFDAQSLAARAGRPSNFPLPGDRWLVPGAERAEVVDAEGRVVASIDVSGAIASVNVEAGTVYLGTTIGQLYALDAGLNVVASQHLQAGSH